jgi:hypothetical protein
MDFRCSAGDGETEEQRTTINAIPYVLHSTYKQRIKLKIVIEDCRVSGIHFANSSLIRA